MPGRRNFASDRNAIETPCESQVKSALPEIGWPRPCSTWMIADGKVSCPGRKPSNAKWLSRRILDGSSTRLCSGDFAFPAKEESEDSCAMRTAKSLEESIRKQESVQGTVEVNATRVADGSVQAAGASEESDSVGSTDPARPAATRP